MRLVTALVLVSMAWAADDPFGAKIYAKHCANCHDAPDPNTRVPAQRALRQMQPGVILMAMETGVMRQQAEALSRPEKRALANYLGTAAVVVGDRATMANPCPASPWNPKPREGDWLDWGAGAANWHHQKSPGIAASDVAKLQVKWVFGFPGSTNVRSQPAVFGGRVFIGSHDGSVYSLDTATGCVHWTTKVTAQVRSGITIGHAGSRWIAILGDAAGYVNALDAATGSPLWKLRADGHAAAMVTAAPVMHEGRVYVGVASYEEASALTPGYVCCSFRGSVMALDGATGKLLWRTYTIAEEPGPGPKSKRGNATMGPSGAGVWSAPTLDPARGLLYVTTGDNYSDPPTKTSDAVMALALDSGEVQWVKQLTAGDAYNSSCSHPQKYNCPDSEGPDHDLGASAMLVPLREGKRALVLAQKSGEVHAVDPDGKGEILWQARVGVGGALGGIQWGLATDGKLVYVPLSDIRYTRAYPQGSLRPIRTLDHAGGGGLWAFRPDNGERMWHAAAPECSPRPCSPAQSAAISSMPGVVFSGSLDGHIRAFAAASGKILWDFDTARDFKTVNGVEAKGGSLDAGAPVAAGGMLFVGSGYSQWGGKPGNVLIAFEVKK